MQDNGQKITQDTYEDPEIIEGYIKANSLNPKQVKNIESFSKLIKGKRVLDLGCGPGHDSYIFSQFGFEVTGLDFSNEMIKRAKTLKKSKLPISFLQGDMRKLANYFKEDEFDAVWASASLLHIRKDDLPSVLEGIVSITKNNHFVSISLKAGEGTKIVENDKYGKPMKREFTLWSKDEFIDFVKPYGLVLEKYFDDLGGDFMGKPTTWHYFIFKVEK